MTAPSPSGVAAELPGRPPDARAFCEVRRPGFADCAPSGRVRLDALARWLQDVAYDDVADAGLEQDAVWVVRRTRMRVRRFPRFGERFELTTFCSGLGRMWAERRTDVVRAGEAAPDVEAVSLWVHLDGEDGRPSRLSEREVSTYAGSGTPRRVTARLRHPAPPSGAAAAPWRFRATDCDIARHVNNAVYFQPLEEELLAGGDDDEPASLDVEIEYRTPAQPGRKRLLRVPGYRWIVDDAGEVHASLRVGDDGD